MEPLEHRSDVLAQVPSCEISTIAVVSAKYLPPITNERCKVMRACGYLSGTISVSRFNRRLHALADWMTFVPITLGMDFLQEDEHMV